MEWRKNRVKEEEDLKKLKDKQAKRKVARAEEEKRAQEKKKQDEEKRIKDIEDKKVRDHENKIKRLEEAEKRRQAMMQALKEQSKKKGPNFIVKGKQAVRTLNNRRKIFIFTAIDYLILLFFTNVFLGGHKRCRERQEQDQRTIRRRKKGFAWYSHQTT